MTLRPIGRIRTPFATLADCPRNGHALDPAPECVAELDPALTAGLLDLDTFDHLILLYWLGPQPDDLQIRPPFDGRTHGVFATRAPVRPNPIGLSVVQFLGRDGPARLRVRYLDCRDDTPLLDIKPYIARTDAAPGASRGWLGP